jgi:hypothetical protein
LATAPSGAPPPSYFFLAARLPELERLEVERFADERFADERFDDERLALVRFEVERLADERLDEDFFDVRLRGTFSPFSRASESPIAIACSGLFTVPPCPCFPRLSVPCLRRRIALSTVFPAARL